MLLRVFRNRFFFFSRHPIYESDFRVSNRPVYQCVINRTVERKRYELESMTHRLCMAFHRLRVHTDGIVLDSGYTTLEYMSPFALLSSFVVTIANCWSEYCILV